MIAATLDRFWSKVDQDGPIPEHKPELGPCWMWTASKQPTGYGQFAGEGRTTVFAHRQSWILAYGPIPDGLWVLHQCDNRACVRPDHLFLGTNADNVADMVAKGRHPEGAASSSAKLSEDDVREIRRSYVPGSAPLLAARFGVSAGTISDVTRGRSWRSLTQ